MAYTKFKPLTLTTYVFKERLVLKEELPKIEDLLASNEKPIVGAKSGQNIVLFTTKRMLIVDPVNLDLGVKNISIPYSSISSYRFSAYRSHSRLKLTLNNSSPINLRFNKDYDNKTIKEIYRIITEYK